MSMHSNSVQELKPATTSLKVADIFGKRHKSVMKLIRDMGIPHEFKRRNFEFVELFEERCGGQKLKSRHYKISRDGFTILAAGLSDKPVEGGAL